MKKYTKPEIMVSTFSSEDVVTASGGLVLEKSGYKFFNDVTTLKGSANRDNSIEF